MPNTDFQNGFLFVGNHPALDFLNTRPVIDGKPQELLKDWQCFTRWLFAAALITSKECACLCRRWQSDETAAEFLSDLRAFREKLRDSILAVESGKRAEPKLLAEVNRLLRTHPMFLELHDKTGALTLRKRSENDRPACFYAPIADAVADLLSGIRLERLRKCETCVLHFYDTSKNGTRRWCSMQLCGNRAKVGAYATRKRKRQESR